MNADDQRKVCEARFTIIRRQNEPKPHIKYKDRNSPKAWKKMASVETDGYYKSIASRDRAMKSLLNKEFYVED